MPILFYFLFKQGREPERARTLMSPSRERTKSERSEGDRVGSRGESMPDNRKAGGRVPYGTPNKIGWVNVHPVLFFVSGLSGDWFMDCIQPKIRLLLYYDGFGVFFGAKSFCLTVFCLQNSDFTPQ